MGDESNVGKVNVRVKICEIDAKELKKVFESLLEIEKEEERFFSELDVSKIDGNEILELLYSILKSDCEYEDGEVFSKCLSSYANGLRFLNKLGLFEIYEEAYRAIRGRFKEFRDVQMSDDEKRECVRILYWILRQDTDFTDYGFEYAESCNEIGARGLRLLSKLGLFEIIEDDGRDKVKGKFVEIF
jgi:hypothetical protein